MASFKLLIRKSVAKDLKSIPKKDVGRILKCFQLLSENPRPPGCEKLSGMERYRFRQGRFRIIYEIRDAELVILVVKEGHRKDVYKNV